MNYQAWVKDVPAAITDDALWRMEVYRQALFLGDVAWHDSRKLVRERMTEALSDQLYRAVGSISANIAEGYSRVSGRDQARFYEYALGSARESRDWYYKGRHVLGAAVVEHRLSYLVEICRQLITIVPQKRTATLRDSQMEYSTARLDLFVDVPLPSDDEYATRNTQYA